MTTYQAELKIPKERVAVLIGTEGIIKKKLETETRTKISIDSAEGEVIISGEDGLNIFDAKEVVQAVGRGFNPKIAFELLKGDTVLEMIYLKDYANTKNAEERLKGRVIGSDGRARRTIETLTDASLVVYGKTIAIIGQPEEAGAAKQAIDMLLTGSPHASVYKWLEKKRKSAKKAIFIQKRDMVKSDAEDTE